MAKTPKVFLLLFVAALVVAQLASPECTNPQAVAGRAIEAHVQVPPAVGTILSRACYDCHSNQTRWPWYSRISPVSFLIADHVKDGRARINFSEWDRPGKSSASRLESICEEVSEGKMPISFYLRIHSEARLSPEDVRVLCEWAKAAGPAAH
jgi:hypothetical protein